MRRLSSWLEIPFTDRNISTQEMSRFTTDHLQRMIANNAGGKLDDRIAATTTANMAFETQFSGDLTKLGLRKGAKKNKEAFLKTLPATMAKLCAPIAAKYGPNSPVMDECCPKGRSVFSKAPDDEMDNHLDIFVTGITAHQADLGVDVVNQAAATRDAWVAVYATSEGATGAKTATQDTKNNARQALAVCLFLNLLKIAELFPGQPEQLATYMQQSLLENHPQQPGDQPAPTPPTP